MARTIRPSEPVSYRLNKFLRYHSFRLIRLASLFKAADIWWRQLLTKLCLGRTCQPSLLHSQFLGHFHIDGTFSPSILAAFTKRQFQSRVPFWSRSFRDLVNANSRSEVSSSRQNFAVSLAFQQPTAPVFRIRRESNITDISDISKVVCMIERIVTPKKCPAIPLHCFYNSTAERKDHKACVQSKVL